MSETDDKLIITLIGQVNSGKTSLFSRLVGMDLDSSKISPVSGWTKEIEMKKIREGIFLADTPGLEDPEQSVSQKTIDFMGASDVFVHVINAAQGVTKTTNECSLSLFDTALPVITVFNKIDTLNLDEVSVFKDDCKNKLPHINSNELMHFISAKMEDGISELKKNILDTIKANEKKIKLNRLFKMNKDIEKILEAEALSYVRYATARALVVSSSFIPFSETLPLTLNQYYMIIKIGQVYEESIGWNQFKSIIGSLGGMVIGTGLATTFFPGWKTAVAGSVTYALGKAMIEWISSGMSMSLKELKEKFERYKSCFKSEEFEEKTMNESSEYKKYSQASETFLLENKNIK